MGSDTQPGPAESEPSRCRESGAAACRARAALTAWACEGSGLPGCWDEGLAGRQRVGGRGEAASWESDSCGEESQVSRSEAL